MNREELAKEGIIQSLLYHTRTDRTTNYVRILGGLETLAIENNTAEIEQILNEINPAQKSNYSELLSMLGIVSTGGLAAGIKALKLLDYGNKTIEKLTKPNYAIPSNHLEKYIRNKVNNIFKYAGNNPQLLEQLNSYYPDHLGNFGDSYEEIVSASPQLADHQKIKNLEDLTQDEKKQLDTIKTELAGLKDKIIELHNQQLAEEEYQLRLNEIEANTVYGRLLAKLIGIKDPKLGQKLTVIVESYRNFAQVSAAYNNGAGNMTSGLAFSNYALIAISLAEAIQVSKGASISEALISLQELIIKSSEAILEGLGHISNQVLELQKSLMILSSDVIDIKNSNSRNK